MEKNINLFNNLSLKELTSKDGAIFEVGNEYIENLTCDEDDDPNISFLMNPDENMKSLLNMDDLKNINESDLENELFDFCNVNFDDFRLKMTAVDQDGKILKLIKKKGVGDLVPSNVEVKIEYVGYFECADQPFDSTFSHSKNIYYQLGKGALLPGLETAICTMQKHEEAIFIIHPDLGFGKLGCPPRIPPNAEILFVIRVIDYNAVASELSLEPHTFGGKRSLNYVMPLVNAIMNKASKDFTNYKIDAALKSYHQISSILETASLADETQENEWKQILTRVYTNIAICYNKINKPFQACSACNRVPTPTSKTYFNHGRALVKIGEYQLAIKKLQIALKMEPNNEEIAAEIQLVAEKDAEYRKLERLMWTRNQNTSKKEKKQSPMQEFCETFVHDMNQVRQPIPEGLSPEEYNEMREHALALGISIVEQDRYGKKRFYLQKLCPADNSHLKTDAKENST